MPSILAAFFATANFVTIFLTNFLAISLCECYGNRPRIYLLNHF